jgi:hypothetical protein
LAEVYHTYKEEKVIKAYQYGKPGSLNTFSLIIPQVQNHSFFLEKQNHYWERELECSNDGEKSNEEHLKVLLAINDS